MGGLGLIVQYSLLLFALSHPELWEEALTMGRIKGTLTVASTLASGGIHKGAPRLLFSLKSSGYPPHCTLSCNTTPHLAHHSPLPTMYTEERAPNWILGALGASVTSANNCLCILGQVPYPLWVLIPSAVRGGSSSCKALSVTLSIKTMSVKLFNLLRSVIRVYYYLSWKLFFPWGPVK